MHLGHIPHENGHAAYRLDGNLPDVLQRRGETYATDKILVTVLLDVAAAGVLVTCLEGIIHVRHGQPRCVQPVSVNRHLVLLHISAPSAHLGHTLRARQLLAHNPVLHRAQVGKAVLILIAFFCAYGVMVDFAKSGRHGGKPHRAFALRQYLLGFLQLLAHLLPRPIHVGGIIEDKRDDRQTAAADAPPLRHSRYVRECHLHGSGDELLHLLRSQRRSLRYYLHLIVGDVGGGVKRQL